MTGRRKRCPAKRSKFSPEPDAKSPGSGSSRVGISGSSVRNENDSSYGVPDDSSAPRRKEKERSCDSESAVKERKRPHPADSVDDLTIDDSSSIYSMSEDESQQRKNSAISPVIQMARCILTKWPLKKISLSEFQSLMSQESKWTDDCSLEQLKETLYVLYCQGLLERQFVPISSESLYSKRPFTSLQSWDRAMVLRGYGLSSY